MQTSLDTTDGEEPRMPRVAFQGERGAYGELAARRFFGAEVEAIPCCSAAEVGQALRSGAAEFGALAVENSATGSLRCGYDVLAREPLAVVGEQIVALRYSLLGLPGAELARLTRVLVHPFALMQCSQFFRAHPEIEAVAVHHPLGAAQRVRDRADPRVGAVIGARVAEYPDLAVLADAIMDRPDLQTRYLIIAPEGVAAPGAPDRRAPRKTLLVLEMENRSGALARALLPFVSRGLNLSRVESHPAGTPWTYRFLLEIEASLRSEVLREALAIVERQTEQFRVLGDYVAAAA